LGTDPAIVAIGVANRPAPGVVGKDTAQNIRNTHEFVINVVNEDIAAPMNICAIDFPPGVNELEKAGLTTVASFAVKAPRIAEAPAALECRGAHHLGSRPLPRDFFQLERERYEDWQKKRK
jgi:Conserved protein/domain typically associated with flavoprotein oxygenases, DIM6/NTAB family